MESGQSISGWQPALERFVEPAWQAIKRQPVGDCVRVDYAALEPELKAQLAERLLMHARRTLVLELNVARLLGLLQGDAPAARFAFFLERLRTENGVWESILSEYPILAERLHTEQQRFIHNVSELLACLVRDWEAIVQTFPGARQVSKLVAIASGLSDGHRGGRSVAKLTFACQAAQPGEGARQFHLVYKPKDLSVDLHFQALLEVCNAAAARGELTLEERRHARPLADAGQPFPSLYRQRLLPRGGYGWVEFIEHKECQSSSEAARFYVRQGGYLALLHVLHATDLHFENVIACGEHPVLVDLETLFHHPFRDRCYDSTAAARAEQLLDGSVLRTGLLPGRAWGDGERPGVNIGGLGNEDAQEVPILAAGFVDSGTDEMQAALKRVYMPAGRNLPRCCGRIAPAAQYVNELVAGFEAMLRYVCRVRDAWVSDGGPLAAFARDEVRQVVRATTVYAKLLSAGTHPDHLRSAEERDQLLTLLAAADALVPAALVQAEQADLRGGDVPFFTTRPGSRDLWDSTGQCHRDHFPVDCLTAVRERCRALDDAEIARQSFLVRAALSASAFGTRELPSIGAGSAQTAQRSEAESAVVGQRARDVAAQLGEVLLRSAIHGQQDATWIGMKFVGESACSVAPLDGDLYDGQAGVALFLAYLGQQTGEQRFVDLAHAAARAVRRSLLSASAAGPCGGFVGLPSQLYALSHAAVVLREPALLRGLAPVHAQLRAAATSVEPVACDVIYGAAGGILALLSLHEASGEEAHLFTAVELGRRLLQAALRTPAGLAWPSHAATRPLLGFAHGTAGIYCALARLAAITAGHEAWDATARECAAAADEALRHERAHFDSAAQNWPDLRGESQRFMKAWCHGAPGILLSRVASGAAAVDATARAEVEAAVATTLGSICDEHTLCHGEVGNLLVTARAAVALARSDWRAEVAERLARLLASLRQAGPRCGFAFPDSAPSLMTGLSGIGYGMLSLAAPKGLPCVLSLDPPAQRQ